MKEPGTRDAGLGTRKAGPRIYESRTCPACGEPSYDQQYCTACAEEIAALEETELAVQVRLLQAGVLTVNEVRAMRGMGPLETGVRDQGSADEGECAGVSVGEDRLAPILLGPVNVPMWLLIAGNVFSLAFLGAVAIRLAFCIVKGLLWVSVR